MRSSSIVLLSGGLDSLAAFHWAYLESDIICGLTFDYGQRAAPKEIEAGRQICTKYDVGHRVITLDWYKEMTKSALLDPSKVIANVDAKDLDNLRLTKKSAQNVWVPNRNGVLVNIAAALAEDLIANWVVVGFNKEEARTFPDNSKDFVETINRAFSFSTKGQVILQSPMGDKNKQEIVQWMFKHQVDMSPLWSCYRGDEKMCGQCESCLRLKRALTENQAMQWMEKLF